MRSADPDVDDVGEGRPAHAAVLATVHGLAEHAHTREHRAHRGHDILAVHPDGLHAAIAQGGVQDRPPFRGIDSLAREHTPDRMLQPRRVRQVVQSPASSRENRAARFGSSSNSPRIGTSAMRT